MARGLLYAASVVKRPLEGVMKPPGVHTLVWFLAFVAVSIILLQTQKVPSYDPSGIIFDTKSFNDTGPTDFGDDVVSIAGTLTGDGVANKNNSVSVTCYQDRMECLIYSIAQIGPNQVGRLDMPNIFPITNWNSDKILAVESGDTVACRKGTINIQRKTKTAVWIEEPINQPHPTCKETHTKTYHWTIEDPPFWKQK
jgi:hypothetical protein